MAAAISQFYILSPRGDPIISRDYRSDDFTSFDNEASSSSSSAALSTSIVNAGTGTSDLFYRTVRFWDGDASGEADCPPVFEREGVHFIWIKQSGLYFVATTHFNLSPSFTLELLSRLVRCFKDYTGVLSEEALRRNFILIYELLDEAIDYGFPQETSTETLKGFVYNEPIVVESAKQSLAFQVTGQNQKTAPSSAVNKPVIWTGLSSATSSSIGGSSSGKQRNEIFVDILERVTCLFSSTGNVINREIDGTIQMKSFLFGSPQLRLALNEDLIIGKHQAAMAIAAGMPVGSAFGTVVLDDANFHECVNLDEFESQRVLLLVPPEGEFSVMNYRITSEFPVPFKITAQTEETSNPNQIEVIVKVRADNMGDNVIANVRVEFPVPKSTSSVSLSSGKRSSEGGSEGQSSEYRAKDNSVVWHIKKFQGGSSHSIRALVTLKESVTSTTKRMIGPVSMSFEVPMFNASGLQVRHLRPVESQKSSNIHRWVRYVTTSSSYVCRLT